MILLIKDNNYLFGFNNQSNNKNKIYEKIFAIF